MKIKLLILLSAIFVFSISVSAKVSAQTLNLTSSGDIPAGIYDNVNISGSSIGTLTGNIIIRGSLNFSSESIINTGEFKISFASTALNPDESNTKGYIVGTAVMESRYVGKGNLEFLGIQFASGNNVGSVTITRVTGTSGRVSIGYGTGIDCRWHIATSIQAERNINFLWIDNFKNDINPYLSTIWNFNGVKWNRIGDLSYHASGDPYVTGPVNAVLSSDWTISDVSSPLPVELTDFIASTIKNEVILDWVTGHEFNNSHFVVERVKLGRTGGTDEGFNQVGTVQGAGNTNNYTHYKFYDKNLETGKYLYRLSQVDYNGNNQVYLLNQEIIVGVPNKFAMSQNFPNPFNPVTKINYEIPEDLNVSMKVYDLAGKEVATMINGVKTAGYHTAELNGSSLASGVYFIRLVAGNFSSIKKISLIK